MTANHDHKWPIPDQVRALLKDLSSLERNQQISSLQPEQLPLVRNWLTRVLLRFPDRMGHIQELNNLYTTEATIRLPRPRSFLPEGEKPTMLEIAGFPSRELLDEQKRQAVVEEAMTGFPKKSENGKIP